MKPTGFREQFTSIADACALAQAIVDTVREPVLVLDKDLRVIAASRSFYSTFKVMPEDTQGRLLYALGDGQWDIPSSACCWKKSYPNRARLRVMRSSINSRTRTAHNAFERSPSV